jgi:signal transduction protein with GAF and PtsI domain
LRLTPGREKPEIITELRWLLNAIGLVSALPLLVPLVTAADDVYDAAAAHHLAVLADPFD